MLFGNKLEQGIGYAGQIDGPINHEFTRARLNPAKSQKGTLTVGGTASDGDYVVTVTNPQEPGWSAVATFTREDSETNAQIAAALAVELNKVLILKATTTNASAVNTLTFGSSELTYSVATSAPGTGTLVWAQTVAPGGSSLPFGRFVKGGGDGLTMLPLESGDAITATIGAIVREMTVENSETFTGYDGIPVGREGAVAAKGPMLIDCEEAVGPADTVYIRIVASGTKTMIGAVGKSADGGNCISAASIARFDGDGVAGGVVRVNYFIANPPA